MKKFEMAICVKGGKVNGHTFKEGDIYPILGYNNGVHICYSDTNNGDPQDLICHTWEHFAPIDGDQFAEQDGTIPPLFDSYRDEEWIDAEEVIPAYDAVSSAKYSHSAEAISERVLVTVDETYPKKEKKVWIGRYCFDNEGDGKAKGWIISNNTYGKVVGWRPLPEPYQK